MNTYRAERIKAAKAFERKTDKANFLPTNRRRYINKRVRRALARETQQMILEMK